MGGRSRPWVVSSLNKSSRLSSARSGGGEEELRGVICTTSSSEVERECGDGAAAETLEAAGVDGDIS
jgi:hypothetical protein